MSHTGIRVKDMTMEFGFPCYVIPSPVSLIQFVLAIPCAFEADYIEIDVLIQRGNPSALITGSMLLFTCF